METPFSYYFLFSLSLSLSLSLISVVSGIFQKDVLPNI